MGNFIIYKIINAQKLNNSLKRRDLLSWFHCYIVDCKCFDPFHGWKLKSKKVQRNNSPLHQHTFNTQSRYDTSIQAPLRHTSKCVRVCCLSAPYPPVMEGMNLSYFLPLCQLLTESWRSSRWRRWRRRCETVSQICEARRCSSHLITFIKQQ